MRPGFIERALDFNSWLQACGNSGPLPLSQNKKANSQSLGFTSMANASLNFSGIHSCSYLSSFEFLFYLDDLRISLSFKFDSLSLSQTHTNVHSIHVYMYIS